MISVMPANPVAEERGVALVVCAKEQTVLSTPRWGMSTKCAFARLLLLGEPRPTTTTYP